MKQISYLDAYDYVRQVLRNLTGFENIRRDDDLRGIPRLGLDAQSIPNLRLALLARFEAVNPNKKALKISKSATPEDLTDAMWAVIPKANKIP